MQGPLLLPEEVDRLAREDPEEDEAIRLAQVRFDELANSYSEETHRDLELQASKGSKNTRRRNQEKLSAYELKYHWEVSARLRSQGSAASVQKADRLYYSAETKRLKRINDDMKAQITLKKIQAKQEAKMPELRAKYIAEYPKRYQQPVESLEYQDLMKALYYTDSNRGKGSESEFESESSWDDDEPNSEDEVEDESDQAEALPLIVSDAVPAPS